MPLAACQSQSQLPSFVPGDAGAAPRRIPAATTIKLPTICRAILQPVDKSPVTAKTDARVAYRHRDAEVDEANKRLAFGGECADDEAAAYAPAAIKGGKK